MEPSPHPLTLTVEQAAKVLGIGRSTAYELVHTGAIPSLRLGRRLVVPAVQLSAKLGATPQAVFAALAVGAADSSALRAALAEDSGRMPQAKAQATLF